MSALNSSNYGHERVNFHFVVDPSSWANSILKAILINNRQPLFSNPFIKKCKEPGSKDKEIWKTKIRANIYS